MPIISVRLTDDLEAQLARESEATLRPKSELVRDAIVEYLEQQERARFRRRLLAAAAARGPEESLAVAAELLPLANEALELAEARMVGDVRGRYRVKQARHK
jgi:predicted DNA-binding protein